MEITLIFLLLTAVFVGTAAVVTRAVKKARARRADLLGAALSQEDEAVVVDQNTGSAECRVRGLPVRFRFMTRGSGSNAESWTEVEVDVPSSQLVLAIRRQRARDAALIRDGLAVDIQLGDPVLDERYLVEGAPADVAERVFSPSVREKLHAIDVDEIDTTPTGIQIARRGWKEEREAVNALVDLAVSLAEAVGPAVTAAKQAAAPPPTSAYRGSAVSPQEQQKWLATWKQVEGRHAAEVAGLEAMRQRRAMNERQRAVLIATVIVLGFLVLGLVLAAAR